MNFLSENGFEIGDLPDKTMGMMSVCVYVCLAGVPDSHRGSSQAGSAGIRAHVCSGARWSLFHPIRCSDARWLGV